MKFSIIIPTLNEASILPFALKTLIEGIEYLAEIEILVSDGGSTDETRTAASQFPVLFVASEKGRARQMNNAAERAMGDYLLFLHADTQSPTIQTPAGTIGFIHHI